MGESEATDATETKRGMTPTEDRLQHEQRQLRDDLLRLTARMEELETQIKELKEKQCQSNQPQ